MGIISTKIGLIIAGVLGVGAIGSKLWNSLRMGHLERKVGRLEQELLVCYGEKAEDIMKRKLQECLSKSKGKARKLKKCQRKYGQQSISG